MPVAGPYYLSWIDEPDPVALRNGTAFNPAVHNRMDEYVFSHRLLLKEGDKPRLRLVIKNPHIGLLNSSRKQWAWFARDIGGTITPLFCGRLIAAPKDLFKEMMTIDLVAWPVDYARQRQKLAEQIKVSGPYDPVFIAVQKRDDPDALLEAVSGLYHIDPVTHVVSISDILNGEDGNVDINADHHLYDEMVPDLDQTSQITGILMDATVSWNQTGQGFIDMGNRTIATYAGDALISEWPKPLQQLGGGYTVAYSNAFDGAGVNSTVTASAAISWTNKEKEHSDGDQLSYNDTVTMPVGFGAGATSILATMSNQTGILDPFSTDGNGDPSPTNIPPKFNASWIYCPVWTVNTSLMLQYRDLDRQRTERIRMLLESDLQPVIVRPEVEQNSETIVMSGTDIGVPIINLLNWTTIAGEAVGLDTIVFPDNPSLPSQRTAQICVSAGIAGIETPNFSDVPGETTNDNTVVWASLGTAAPTETAFDWPANSNVGLGTIILPRRPLVLTYLQLTQAGRQQFPPVGTQISLGTLIRSGNGAYHVATLPGLTKVRSSSEPAFGTTRGSVLTDGSVEWTCIGANLPDGKTHFLCVQAGKTGAQFMIPQFDNALHARTTDGSVIWAAIGPGEIPAGGTPGDVWARSYFDTVRGRRSLEYLIAVLRARGRRKARAVPISFAPIDPFGLGLQLTLRKTATLHDRRLGGGIATGKLISIEFTCDGATGRETCRAQIGCAIGKDNVITPVAGSPTYCDEDYCDPDYQYHADSVVVVGDASDVGYTVPVFVPNDDGLLFPLTKSQIVISEGVRGSFAEQGAAVGGALGAMAEAAKLSSITPTSLDYSASLQRQIRALSGNSIASATALSPIWYDAVLKPLTGWQFNNAYSVSLTKLTCQKGIDLEGASTP